jgi:hypothetical protein
MDILTAAAADDDKFLPLEFSIVDRFTLFFALDFIQ